MTVLLLDDDGDLAPLDLARWHAPASEEEVRLLRSLDPPVLDLGCGPGRLVRALAEEGIAALGVDASPAAVDTARRQGANVICRSLFDRLPGEGRWRSIVLLDGNIGIGGDPVALLRRVEDLLGAGGEAIVETGDRATATRIGSARLQVDGELGPVFPWARVSAADLPALAADVDLELVEWLRPDGRWLARLRSGVR